MLRFIILKAIVYPVLIIFPALHGCAQDTAKIKALNEQAFEQIQSGNYFSSIKINSKILELDPANYRAANEIAGLYGMLGQAGDEIAWAKKAIAMNPDYAKAYITLGNGFGGSGDKETALKYYKEAARLDPESPLAPYCIGVLDENRGDDKSAISYYKISIGIDSAFTNAYCGLATSYASLQDFTNALIYIQKALQLNPKSQRALEIQERIREQKTHL